MRPAWLVLLIACSKEKAADPKPAPGSAGSAAVALADAHVVDAAPVLVDLLRSVPTTVRVSSQVKNPKIKPEHIVDGSLDTAWNSKTGELVGAWIEVALPAGATAKELKLTVGHTGKGQKGEDYFTMNPRVKAIEISVDGTSKGEVKLDVARRELHTIPIDAAGTLRLRVTAFEPGSKKQWKEIAISELEVWGTPPAGFTPPAKPLVPTVEVAVPPGTSAFAKLCEGLEDDKAERERQRRESDRKCMKLREPERSQCMVDPPGDPNCDVSDVSVDGIAPPWRAAAVHCEVHDDVYGPKSCSLVLDVDGTLVHGPGVEGDHKAIDLEVDDAKSEDVIKGGAPELVFTYKTTEYSDSKSFVTVCRTAPAGCSEPQTTLDLKKLVFK